MCKLASVVVVIVFLSAWSAAAENLGDLCRRMEARFGGEVPKLWGERMDGIRTRVSGDAVLALTFDACGGARGSGSDLALIEILRSYDVPATLFLNARWIASNDALFRELVADPLFEIGDHGAMHRPLSVTGRSAWGLKGTAGVADVVREVEGGAHAITAAGGKRPCFFRAGGATYDDVAVRIVRELGYEVAGFEVNGDLGATASAVRVRDALLRAPDGAIVLMHMNHPEKETAEGVAAALPILLARGVRFVRLSDLPTE